MTDPANLKRNRQKGAPQFLRDPRKSRPNETIGGGFFVFRRGGGSRRIRAPEYPFEHASLAEAQKERDRLSQKYPGNTFIVVEEVALLRREL